MVLGRWSIRDCAFWIFQCVSFVSFFLSLLLILSSSSLLSSRFKFFLFLFDLSSLFISLRA